MPSTETSPRPRKRVYFQWDDLIDYIAEAKVIPICGPELLEATIDGEKQNICSYVNREVAKRLDIDLEDHGQAGCFRELAFQHLREEGELRDLYKSVGRVLAQSELEPPESLRRLARIRNFNLFLSTTPDGFLSKAINMERFGDAERTLRLAYLNNGSQEEDLPCLRKDLELPVVYHLFGYRSTSVDYALTDADLLEYVTSLHDKARQPKRLFQELKDHHLLFLGTGHTGWMARFLLRTARTTPLESARRRHELLVETGISGDPSQIHFLDRFSEETKLCPRGEHESPVQFVDELYHRIAESRPDLLISDAADEAEGLEGSGGDVTEGAIFLSYASGDFDAAQRIYETLTQEGLDVWFDKNALRSGNYKNQINQAIRKCSFFVPVISNNSHDPQTFDSRWFRREWDTAIRELLPGKAPGVVKIHPLRIHDVSMIGPGIPSAFDEEGNMHGPLAPDGQLAAKDVAEVVRLYRDWMRRQRGGGE